MTTMERQASGTVHALDGMVMSHELEEALAMGVAQSKDSRVMTAERRQEYVLTLCRALKLNPLTNPVQFIVLNGREVLYLTRTATDQLAAMHSLNRRTIRGPEIMDVCGVKVAICVVEVTLPNGRSETATATLPVIDHVNLYMKLETKAKRRGTLSILGLGVLAEDELETIPDSVKGVPLTITPEPVASARRPTYPAAPGTSPTQPAPAADPLAAALADVSSERPASLRSLARDAVADAPTGDTLVDDVVAQASRCETATAAVDLWRTARVDLATDPKGAATAWDAVWKRVAELQRSTEKAAKQWIKRALLETDGPKPDGTSGPTKPRSARETTATGNGAANDSASTAGAVACVREPAWAQSPALLRQHLAGKTCIAMLRNSAMAHARELTDDAQRLYAERYRELAYNAADDTRPVPSSALATVRGWIGEAVRNDLRRAA